MEKRSVVYQIYPLGFCGAPRKNDGIPAHRIRRITEWIPHLKQLGITAVLLNPVFQSETHGYDTVDFDAIDCRLGTGEDFRAVSDRLHDAGIALILDGVFHHVGRSFPRFCDVVEKRRGSPFQDWFRIDFSRWEEPYGFHYEGWEGHRELVKLNLDNPDVRAFLISRALHWVRAYRIDGLRLDTAYLLPETFLRELTDALRAEDPGFFFLGEMIHGDYNRLLHGRLLDSVTNYECRKGIYSSFNSHNLFEIAYSLNRQFGKDPWALYKGTPLLSFLDNHDVDRIASVLSDPRDLPLAYGLLFAMPGIPCLYYGSEWGARGKRQEEDDSPLRPCFKKPEWNGLTDLISLLCRLRRTHPSLSDGDYAQDFLRSEQLSFLRSDAEETILFAVNCAEQEAHFPSPGGRAADLLHGGRQNLSEGFSLAGKSFGIWQLAR